MTKREFDLKVAIERNHERQKAKEELRYILGEKEMEKTYQPTWYKEYEQWN